MGQIVPTKGARLLEALLAHGWRIKRHDDAGHPVLEHEGHADFLFAFEDVDDLGPVVASKIARKTAIYPHRFGTLPVSERGGGRMRAWRDSPM